MMRNISCMTDDFCSSPFEEAFLCWSTAAVANQPLLVPVKIDASTIAILCCTVGTQESLPGKAVGVMFVEGMCHERKPPSMPKRQHGRCWRFKACVLCIT